MFSGILERIALALEGERINYMVVGGQAVLLYGEARLTRDIDITLDLGAADSGRIIDLAEKQGWRILVDSPEQFIAETMVLPCREETTGIRIDFILSSSPYEKQAFGRVNRVEIGKAKVRFASPEDITIHKMVAGRPRDLEDVKAIMVRNPGIDIGYVREWLAKLGEALACSLLDSFDRIRSNSRSFD